MRRKGEERPGRYPVVLAAIIILAGLGLACGPNPAILNSGKETPARVTGERPASSLEKDLETMRTANFEYVFVLRRKDSGKLDADDKAFIRQNKPVEINRVVVSDDDKAVIAGSHFPFPPEALKLLQARFNFEDLSNPANAPAESNVNANVDR
jgi:hypothetical protein